VPEPDFDFYKDAVNSAYRLHDLLLGRLLQLAGPNTTIILVSDHGFHSDLLRPRATPRIPVGPAIWHRPLGILCARGAGLKRDERIYGTSLLDIAPTILTLFGLPVGQDMEGRVLVEAFEQPPPLEFIPSWEEVPGNSGMHAGETELPPEESAALLEQFIALGYIDRPDQNRERAAAACLLEQNWNLSRVYLETARYAEALELLEQVHAEAPDRSDITFLLARCQARLGLLDEAEQTMVPMLEEFGEVPFALLVRGNIAFDRGHYSESPKLLLQAEKAEPRLPDLHVAIGNTHLRCVRYGDAERAFERALEIDPHSAQARLGLAFALLRQRRYDEAAGAAILAVGLQHHLPMAHFYLGCALVRLQLFDRAIQAFEMAVNQRGPLYLGHRWLARLYKNRDDEERAAYHLAEALKNLDQRKEIAARVRFANKRRPGKKCAQTPRYPQKRKRSSRGLLQLCQDFPALALRS